MNCHICGQGAWCITSQGCHPCRIKDKDPIDWLISEVTDKFVKHSTYETVSLNRQGEYSREEHISIALSYSKQQGYYFSCWDADGHAYPNSYFGLISLPELKKEIETAILRMWHNFDEEMGPCSKCDILLSKKNMAGRHFAGGYCASCWSSYVKDNSRICTLCNSPEHSCCC